MSEGGRKITPAFTSDLAFSFITYFVLSTILGVCAIALRPELEPFIGRSAAETWWLPVVIVYCAWQFRRFRRLRREPTSDNPGSD
jgi:hypothetical protein